METVSVAIACSLLSAFGIIVTISRNKNKDTKEDVSVITKIGEEIKYVSKSTDDIKYEVRNTNKSISDMNERLIRVEESCKSAHKRIDGVEKEGV